MVGLIKTLQTEKAALVARAEAAEAEGVRVQARLAKVENQLDRFRAEKFWDRLMREIAEILAARGPLTPSEILPELRAVTIRGAALHRQPASNRPTHRHASRWKRSEQTFFSAANWPCISRILPR